MSTHEARLPLFDGFAHPIVKKYHTIVADPPWRYNAPAYGYGADANYPTMTVDQLMNLPVGLWAAEKAHLYLWTTNTFIVEAHKIAKAWGFEPKTLLTWIKRRPSNDQWQGMGHYFRGTTEHVVFATRENLNTLRADQVNFIEAAAEAEEGLSFFAARGTHSEKPGTFYDLVAKMSPGPYLDVFARTARVMAGANFEVMDTFGNETFNPAGLRETLTDEQAQGLVFQ